MAWSSCGCAQDLRNNGVYTHGRGQCALWQPVTIRSWPAVAGAWKGPFQETPPMKDMVLPTESGGQ